MKVGNAARQYKNNPEKLIEEYEILRVGKKYFYLKGFKGYGRETQFCKEKLTEVTNYSPNYYVYFSMQEIEEEREFYVKLDQIRDKIGKHGDSNLSLEKIRMIYNILFTEENK